MLKILLLFMLILLPISSHAEEAKLVEVTIAKRQDFSSQVSLVGTVSSKQETTFVAKYNGNLTKIFFKDGSLVKKGDIIAEMENEDSLDTYQLAIQSEAIARDQFDRALKLYNQGHLKKESLEDKKQKWNLEKQNLSKAKKHLEDSYLRAPFDGKLSVFKVKQGSHLKAGSEIVTLYNPTNMQIDLNIPESLATKVKIGTEVLVNDKHLKITSIEHIINKETRMIDTKIDLGHADNLADTLIGSIIDVLVDIEKKQNTLLVPKSCLFIKNGKNNIYRINNGKAELIEVKIGNKNDQWLEILEGLNEGDQVILFGQSALQDGDLVKVCKR